jgi:hypothetical protein
LQRLWSRFQNDAEVTSTVDEGLDGGWQPGFDLRQDLKQAVLRD